jgi:adenylosuccinate synthase
VTAHVVFDLGFGDAGKGRLVDALVRRTGATLVVRAHGGAQAGHNVVGPDGRHHTFSSFGAGSFVPGVGTHLGPEFVVHPLALAVEARVLASKGVTDVLARTTLDARARVTTPFQQAAGRLRELLRGSAAHGTCGVGVGETVADALGHDDGVTAANLADRTRLAALLARQQERKVAELPRCPDDPRAGPEWAFLRAPDAVERVLAAWLEVAPLLRIVDPDTAERRLAEARTLVFEGAQGVLLDETWGFAPHTTWSDCTPGAALRMLRGADRPVVRWAVTRTYATRHGPGPFPTEDPAFTFPEPHNGGPSWQGAFRQGPLDGVLLRYALGVAGGADALAVTHVDRAVGGLPWVPRWDDGTERLEPGGRADTTHREVLGRRVRTATGAREMLPGPRFASVLAERLAVPLRFESHGPALGAERW